ncbi:hypothetical protein H4684_004114 [Desulfomicrobium macestii]|uniref:Uncharacterized protein n=1 Tax=Desulfomicrobium macestii TaxID=90731 RepID=A0ABR9H9L1_9BACT|nr:hypothetical protein [Desulfomicrobium macestii]
MLTGQPDGLCEQSPDLLGYIWTGEELGLILSLCSPAGYP